VTPVEYIDKAIEIASRPEVTLCSFGDMLRVPGTESDLLGARTRGGDVRFVYSPLDALTVARAEPDRQVVFFAVGFETTAPANAMAVYRAHREGIRNFSMLVSHVLVPPAMCALLDAPTNRVQGFLAAGHVCTVMGTRNTSRSRRATASRSSSPASSLSIFWKASICASFSLRKLPGRSRTVTADRFAGKETVRRKTSSVRCSKSSHAVGAVSGRSRIAVSGSLTPMSTKTQR